MIISDKFTGIMKTIKVLILLIFITGALFGQEQEIVQTKKFDLTSMTYLHHDQNITYTSTETQKSLGDFNPDCDHDFWTVNTTGHIQEWSLVNGNVIGGDTIISGAEQSLAYCGTENSSTFYSAGSQVVKVYDQVSGWTSYSLPFTLLNNGGFNQHQYFQKLVNVFVEELVYYDGSNYNTIETLGSGEEYTIADVAVDTLGRGWLLKGPGITTWNTVETNSLEVFDSSGNLNSFYIFFNSYGAYGSMFLNDTMYIGVRNNPDFPNSLIPIIVSGNVAQLGIPIPFDFPNLADLASCQNVISTVTSLDERRITTLNAYPNPTSGLVNLSLGEKHLKSTLNVYNSCGQLIRSQSVTVPQFDIQLPDEKGVYLIQFVDDIGTSESIRLIRE
jgi:hypothetical protein